MNAKLNTTLFSLLLAAAVGCGDNLGAGDGDGDGDDLERPDDYSFPSRFEDGASAVSYSGQVFRQTLITALDNHIANLTARIDNDQEVQTFEIWRGELDFFYRFDADVSLDQPIGLELSLPTVQQTWGDISGGANLIAKTAGEDDVTDHADWDGGAFAGWQQGDPGSPVALIDLWLDQVAQAAVDRNGGASIPTDPFGDQIAEVYITAEGQDLKQLIQKFLLGAITFSQGTDDYLDSGTAEKGLEAANTQNGDDPFTTLEHQWDEGFGYFGARRDYNVHADADNAGPGYADSDGDQRIDLESEINSGMALNAAKRDRDAVVATDFSSAIFEALITGRHIIWRSAGEPLSEEQRAELVAQRDIVVENWEKVFAATAVHYINEVIAEMDKITGDGPYSFADHAEVWSELKGFSLAFQFNPRSALSDADFATLHELIGDAPVISNSPAMLSAYAEDLLAARDLLRDTYGFDQANVEAW